MAALHHLEAQIEAHGSVVASVVDLLGHLHDELKKAGTDEAKLNELADHLEQQTQVLAEAVAKNTLAEGEVNQ